MQFRLRTLLIVLAVGPAVLLFDGLGATTSAAEPSGLSAFANKQLTRLPEGDREKLANSFKELTGDELGKFDDPDSIQPFLISKFSAGDGAWIFVEAYQGWEVPGLSAMRVHVFDSHWKRLFKQSFPTGYRMFLADVTVERHPDLGCDVLVGKLVYSARRKELLAAGRYVRAHFARQGGALELVRHEEADGTLSQQWYGVNPAFIIGPAPPQRTPDAWIGSLRSKDPVEQVAALVWVSGRHLPSTERRVEGISQEPREQALAYEAVRDSKVLREILNQLEESPTQLVKDYVRFTHRLLTQGK